MHHDAGRRVFQNPYTRITALAVLHRLAAALVAGAPTFDKLVGHGGLIAIPNWDVGGTTAKYKLRGKGIADSHSVIADAAIVVVALFGKKVIRQRVLELGQVLSEPRQLLFLLVEELTVDDVIAAREAPQFIYVREERCKAVGLGQVVKPCA